MFGIAFVYRKLAVSPSLCLRHGACGNSVLLASYQKMFPKRIAWNWSVGISFAIHDCLRCASFAIVILWFPASLLNSRIQRYQCSFDLTIFARLGRDLSWLCFAAHVHTSNKTSVTCISRQDEFPCKEAFRIYHLCSRFCCAAFYCTSKLCRRLPRCSFYCHDGGGPKIALTSSLFACRGDTWMHH